MSKKLDSRLDENDPIYQYLIKKFPSYSWNYVKNQHYVPVFYQKSFSLGKDNDGNDLIRHRNKHGACNDPIRDFCTLDFTYGRDCHLEAAYSWSENCIKHILDDMVRNPRNNHFKATFSRRSLIEFLASLDNRSIRTVAMQKQFIKMNEDCICKMCGITDFIIDTHLSDKPNLFVSLDDSWINESFFFDCGVIINNSSLPFITSDCPLCVYNPKYLEHYPVPQYDKSTEGAIWYLPLSPIRGLVLYDNRHYSIGLSKGTITIDDERQIDELNKLTVSNAYDEIIYGSDKLDDYTERLMAYLPDKIGPIDCFKSYGRGFFVKNPVQLSFIKSNSRIPRLRGTYERHTLVADFFYEVLEEIIKNGLDK